MASLGDAIVQFPILTGSYVPPNVHLRTIQQATSASLSILTASAGSQMALPENPNRIGAIFCNDSPSVMYVRFGTGPASSANFTAIYPALDLTAATRNSEIQHERLGGPVYTGQIHVAWASATGSLKVTELT